MTIKEHNFEFLLASLLLLLIVSPILRDFAHVESGVLTEIGFSVVIILAVWSLHASRVWFYAGIALCAGGVVFDLLFITSGVHKFVYLAIVSNLLFLILTIAICFRQLVHAHEINMNSIMGAVCVYLLIGVIWSLLFAMTELLLPGSFEGIANASVEADSKGHAFLYYSFVTLTTLGYGDILPISSTARALAYAEAVLGQFYIAVLVAGLVSILASKGNRSA